MLTSRDALWTQGSEPWTYRPHPFSFVTFGGRDQSAHMVPGVSRNGQGASGPGGWLDREPSPRVLGPLSGDRIRARFPCAQVRGCAHTVCACAWGADTPPPPPLPAAAPRQQRPLHRRLRGQGGPRRGLLLRVQALRAQSHRRGVRREGEGGPGALARRPARPPGSAGWGAAEVGAPGRQAAARVRRAAWWLRRLRTLEMRVGDSPSGRRRDGRSGEAQSRKAKPGRSTRTHSRKRLRTLGGGFTVTQAASGQGAPRPSPGLSARAVLRCASDPKHGASF